MPSHAYDQVVKIGVLALRGPTQAARMWSPMAVYLTSKLPGHVFTIVPLGFNDVVPAVEGEKVDFVLVNSGIYIDLADRYGADRIATLRNRDRDRWYTEFGGVIFTRADRVDIRILGDLKGKSFMAVDETSFGGWWAAWRELRTAGIEPERDFRPMRHGATQDAVVYAVRDGLVDAGTVRTDTLERMAAEGRIDLSDYHVLNRQHHEGFGFLSSTRLYPEWPIAKLRHTPEELSRRVAEALLQMPPDSEAARAAQSAGWAAPLDYQPVRDLLMELRVGPPGTKDGKISLPALLQQHSRWFLLAALGVLSLGLAAAYVVTLKRRLGRVRTQLRQSRDALQEANRKIELVHAQLLQSEKMASIGQLAAGVAHEINNPIGYINSNLGTLANYVRDLLGVLSTYEELERDFAHEPGIQARLRHVKVKMDLDYLKQDLADLVRESQEGVAHIKQIVQDLQTFSHADDGEWRWADLHKGLESTLNIVWNELKYKAEVVKEYGELPRVHCVPSQLNQVFMNLLVNAAQAIEERGAIVIRTGRTGDDWVWVEISDTGCGIEPEVLPSIFDPFFTTKQVGKGTGLGLALSRGIVERHGGRIEIESEAGKGTTFIIHLPVGTELAEQPQEKILGAAVS
ncbi:MAG: PhnD/SsuA/transferrin family substrate-binding protein [Gammaproteobacteria bacterium]